MATKKHFLQDRSALLLVTGNGFLALVAVVLTLLKLGTGQGTSSYIVTYRPSLGIDAFKTGTVLDIVSFILFAVLVAAVGIMLGYRTYQLKRELSLTILSLTLLVLAFAIIVVNALLALR